MLALAGKVAIVTGASSGIGRATARLFAEQGARVVVAARRQHELDTLVSEVTATGAEAVALAGDVRDEAFAKRLAGTAVERFGGLDVAFNNAGVFGELTPTWDRSIEDWQDVLATNLTSAFLGAKHQIPVMLQRGGGSIIFTSSFVGCGIGLPGAGAYAASKAGIVGLMQVLAAELGDRGIRANAILPGGVDTPMNMANAPDAGPEVQEFVNGLHAVKRIASPEEIAQSVLYLASDASSFVTGEAHRVDGGVSISRN
jgi:NAD(P)-dependent dehydrogenase (short-subunit alcohol dehydrogenase family)